jgi:hypothetical protein
MAVERSCLPFITGTMVHPPAAARPAPRLDLALAALRHNQGLVTFVDGKANSLLLVNSIFLATTATAGGRTALPLATLGLAALALLLCLAVIAARGAGLVRREAGRLIFFEDVLARRTARDYHADLVGQSDEAVLESTAEQVFLLAGIVDRKFRAYRRAQLATLLAAGLWTASLLARVLS